MKKVLMCLILMAAVAVDGHAEIESQKKIVVTASRIGQLGYKLASNITIITREDIESSTARTVPELLQAAVGANLQSYGTSKRTTVDIRGFGDTARSNILVLVNDRRVNVTDISAPDLIQIPLDSIEQIEIIRGGGSALYGDNAVGGVINIITKQGQGDLSGKLTAFTGSYDKQGINAELSGRQKDISYYVFSQYFDKRGYRQNSDVLAKDFNGRFGYDVSETFAVDLNLGWHEDNFGLPGGLSEAELNSLGRKGSPGEADAGSTKDRFVNIGFDMTPWPDDGYLGEVIIDYYYRNLDTYSEFNEFAGFETHTKSNHDIMGVTGKYIFDREILDHDVNFVTGVDYYQYEQDILGSGSVFSTDDITIVKDEIGIFGFLEFETLENLSFNAGSRYQKAEYSFDQRNIANFDSDTAEEVVSMGGAKYEYAPGSNVHFSAQQTFRFLQTNEWYSIFSGTLNTDLEQQRGIQFEAGIKHNFDDTVVVSLTPYMMRLKHEIYFDPSTFANTNYPETKRIGIEFTGDVDILKLVDIDFLDALDFTSNFNWQNPEFEEGPNKGNDIPMVPRYQASAAVTTKFLDYFLFSIHGSYVGSRWAINDISNGDLHGTTPVKPHYLLDAKLAFENEHMEVFAAINNITNEKYNSVVTKSGSSSAKNYFPAPERNYVVGASVKF